jgi:uncharacterized UPF0160 family protein
MTKEFSNSIIIRSRNPEDWKKSDCLVDVGAEYNPEKHQYDHHQLSFKDTFEGYKIRLSSAGIVYK